MLKYLVFLDKLVKIFKKGQEALALDFLYTSFEKLPSTLQTQYWERYNATSHPGPLDNPENQGFGCIDIKYDIQDFFYKVRWVQNKIDKLVSLLNWKK